MSKNEGRGSILLKILIVVLIAGLIAVIIIPGRIWDEENREMNTERDNMMSIYEAEKFYSRINGSYTTDPTALINSVRQDSSLLQLQQVVNYTKQLIAEIESYKTNPFIKGINDVDKNIELILDDLESNRRNFRLVEEIKNEAETLELRLSELNSSTQHVNYVTSATYIDSLVLLRRDLSDFSLQTAASRAFSFTDTLKNILAETDIARLEQDWKPLSNQLDAFIKKINGSELTKVTSVADRIKDFKKAVDNAFTSLSKVNIEKNIADANVVSKKLNDRYQTFLKDFIVTSKLALYRLSDSDSLVLHLTENNFMSPVTGEEYKILLTGDSSAVKVESPILLKELREKLVPVAESIETMAPMGLFAAYFDTLDALKAKALEIRKTLRKNTDIFIKYKELEELIGRFQDITITSSYGHLTALVEKADSCESFSELKLVSEDALNGIRVFNQAYSENFFGNLDSLHRDVRLGLEEFNGLLDNVRRLPRSVKKFDNELTTYDALYEQIKTASSPELLTKITEAETELGNIYLFASEGQKQKLYGLFEKKIENLGYIFKDSKSWEEEQ